MECQNSTEILKLCRGCLTSYGDFLSIDFYSENFSFITGLKISQDDFYLRWLCLECRTLLNYLQAFKIQALKVELALQNNNFVQTDDESINNEKLLDLSISNESNIDIIDHKGSINENYEGFHNNKNTFDDNCTNAHNDMTKQKNLKQKQIVYENDGLDLQCRPGDSNDRKYCQKNLNITMKKCKKKIGPQEIYDLKNSSTFMNQNICSNDKKDSPCKLNDSTYVIHNENKKKEMILEKPQPIKKIKSQKAICIKNSEMTMNRITCKGDKIDFCNISDSEDEELAEYPQIRSDYDIELNEDKEAVGYGLNLCELSRSNIVQFSENKQKTIKRKYEKINSKENFSKTTVKIICDDDFINLPSYLSEDESKRKKNVCKKKTDRKKKTDGKIKPLSKKKKNFRKIIENKICCKKDLKINKGWRSIAFDTTKVKIIDITLDEQIKQLEDKRTSKNFCDARYKCEFCARIFPSIESMELHMKRHSDSSGLLKCPICQLRFKSKINLKDHIKMAHSRRFQCLKCKETFHQNYSVAIHVMRHENVYICQICGHHSKSVEERTEHRKTHFPSLNLKCSVCSKIFTSKHSYQTHLNRHKGNMPFLCDICGKCCQNKSTLAVHKITHSSTREFHCASCNISYKSKDTLLSHLRHSLKHIDPALLIYPCDQCEEKFDSEVRRENHIDSHHIRSDQLTCDACSKSYSTSRGLRIHRSNKHGKQEKRVDIHNPTHICEVCGRGFYAKVFLMNHVRRHTGEQQFVCETCGHSFFTNDLLKLHIRVHTGYRPYTCEICQTSFTQDHILKGHIKRTHSKLDMNQENETSSVKKMF